MFRILNSVFGQFLLFFVCEQDDKVLWLLICRNQQFSVTSSSVVNCLFVAEQVIYVQITITRSTSGFNHWTVLFSLCFTMVKFYVTMMLQYLYADNTQIYLPVLWLICPVWLHVYPYVSRTRCVSQIMLFLILTVFSGSLSSVCVSVCFQCSSFIS